MNRQFRTDLNANFEDVDKDIQSQKGRVDELIQKNPQPSEVVDARGGFPVLRDRLDSVNAQLAQNMNKVSDYNLFPQSPRPPKQGLMTNSPKIVWKTGVDAFTIIQKTNKGYLKYVLDTKNGKVADQSNAGESWDLVRLKQVRPLADCYLFYDISTPVSGTLEVATAPQVYANPEAELLDIGNRNDSRTFSSKNGVEGVGVYTLAPSSEVTFSIPVSSARKMNLLFQSPSGGGSPDVEIQVNNVTVKNFDSRIARQDTSAIGYALVEFEIPTRRNSPRNMIVKIINKSTVTPFYPVCINFVLLKDWNKEVVNNFKALGSTRNDFIDEVGASDYAFMNKDRVLFGSYHGGEVRSYGMAMWTTQNQEDVDSYGSLKDFAEIPNGEWKILKDFKIVQKTSLLNGQAKMTSEFDFNIDGTMEMKFALTESTIEFISMYTALTCCGPTFNYVGYPWLSSLPPTDENYYTVPLNEGYIVQYDPQLTGQEIVIRFTKFNDTKNFRGGAYIWNSSNYKKFYYGTLVQADNVGGTMLVNNLTFSKGLDFNIK